MAAVSTILGLCFSTEQAEAVGPVESATEVARAVQSPIGAETRGLGIHWLIQCSKVAF